MLAGGFSWKVVLVYFVYLEGKLALDDIGGTLTIAELCIYIDKVK